MTRVVAGLSNSLLNVSAIKVAKALPLCGVHFSPGKWPSEEIYREESVVQS